MLELITLSRTGEQWYLNKVIINSDHISIIVEDDRTNDLLKEGKIELGFSKAVRFSRVKMQQQSGFDELIAVGTPTEILEKIKNTSNKKLLKG
tara:strand:+ start:867 stop:1145 length:279 start_codon:yes stop_codon:yes gene_type:complete